MSFFPQEDYKLPVSSNYMKFREGDNNFRVLSGAVIGWEYWNTQNKPVRVKDKPEEIPEDIKTEKDGNVKINHFWAFAVYNYEAQKIQILELTQKGIMKTIHGLVKNPKWGDPKGYDITVTRVGTGLDTEYGVVPNPHTPLAGETKEQYEKLNIDLEALFMGKDPFGK